MKAWGESSANDTLITETFAPQTMVVRSISRSVRPKAGGRSAEVDGLEFLAGEEESPDVPESDFLIKGMEAVSL